jgi:hypothetical protein
MASKQLTINKAISLLSGPRSFLMETRIPGGNPRWDVVCDNGKRRGGWLSTADAHTLISRPFMTPRRDGLFSGDSQTFVLTSLSSQQRR